MARGQKLLYVGTNRHIAALDPKTGEELWRTKFPKGGVGATVSIVIKGTSLYVGCFGHVFCLDKHNGSILWENDLPRLGYHTVLLALEGAAGATARDAVAATEQLGQQR